MLDLTRFEDAPHLLDLLLQVEDVLDSLDLYVFKNWFKGEVVEGPIVHRYWMSISLRYPIEKMPDPRGAKRMLKQDILTFYSKVVVSDNEETDNKTEQDPTHWVVEIRVPRRLVADINAAELDFYDDDEIDIEDVQDAQDSGITDESAYEEDGGQDSDGSGEEGIDDINF